MGGGIGGPSGIRRGSIGGRGATNVGSGKSTHIQYPLHVSGPHSKYHNKRKRLSKMGFLKGWVSVVQ